jgi:hypothetical protein
MLFSQFMNFLVAPVYIFMTLCALISITSPYIYSLSLYGKMTAPQKSSESIYGETNAHADDIGGIWKILHWIKRYQVNKIWFTSYYAFGLLWASLVFLNERGRRVSDLSFELALLWILLLLHLARRLVECLCIHVWSSSTMNITAFFMGMIYYCFLPYVFIPLNHMVQRASYQDYISLNIPLQGTETRFLRYSPFPFGNTVRRRWMVMFAVVLIIWGQYEQYKHHAVLAELRKNGTEKGVAPRSAYRSKYRLPQGRWFYFVSSPHYLSEIIVYVGLITLLKCSSSQNLQESFNSVPSPVRYIDHDGPLPSYTLKILLYSSSSGFKACALMSWIVTNLSISAHRNHKWYQHEFINYPGNPMMKRKALIPFIW